MKTRVLLVASLLLNAGLAAAFFLASPVSSTRVEGEANPSSSSTAKNPKKADRTVRTIQKVVDRDLDWARVEASDYREYIANLRDISCPEETIRDIIIADINKLYASKMAALYPSPKEFKFWKVEDRVARREGKELDEQRHVLEKEKRDLIKELLGVDYEQELARLSGRPDEDAWRYGFLTPEQQEQVRALRDKYRDQERAMWNENGGNWNAETRAKWAAMRAQREAELAQLLGPQEFQEYMLRNSWTARNMREELTAFQPNEEEFRKVFEMRKGFDDQFGFTRDGGDEALREQRRVAQQQLDEQMRALLGEQRFHEYQISQSPRFREIYDFAQRHDLPRSTAEAAYDIRRAAEDQRRKLESDGNLTGEQRSALLKTLSSDTENALTTTFGPEVWTDYRRRDGGWVRDLARVDGGRGGDRSRR
jgi:hypothetical protein